MTMTVTEILNLSLLNLLHRNMMHSFVRTCGICHFIVLVTANCIEEEFSLAIWFLPRPTFSLSFKLVHSSLQMCIIPAGTLQPV